MSPRSNPAGWGTGGWGTMPWGSVAGWGDGQWGDFPWGGDTGVPSFTPLTTYRLELAERSAAGFGASIISDVFAAGLPFGSEYACRWSRGIGTAGTIEFTLPIEWLKSSVSQVMKSGRIWRVA